MRLNGNLTLPTGGLGEIQNMVVERLAATPANNATNDGRIIYNTVTDQFLIGVNSAWLVIATGGDATALQTEVDNIEAAMGALIDTDGNFVSGAFGALTNIGTPANLLAALAELDAAIESNDSLAELDDTTLTSLATSDVLVYNGTVWENQNEAVFKASLNLEIGTDIQAFDATLTSLAAFNTDGILVQTTADTFVGRTIVSTSTGLVVATGDGVAANPSLSLDASLQELSALTLTNGDILYVNGSGEIASAAAGVTSGVQPFDETLVDLATLPEIAVDQMIVGTGAGTVGYTAITADARALLDDANFAAMRATLGLVDGGAGDTWVNAGGDTMTGDLAMGANFVISSAVPTIGSHLVNKTYVDNNLAGLKWKNSAIAATTANITLSNTQTIDTIVLAAGDRVLVKNQSTVSENGIYVVVDGGAWTRATDFDSVTSPDEINSGALFVEQGAVNADTGWTQTATVATFPGDDLIFTQFNGAAGVTAGEGLVKTGNTLDINMGAGIGSLPSDEVGIDLYAPTGGGLQLTTDGTAATVGASASHQLSLVLGGATLGQDSTGLFVTDAGITETQLNASIAGNGIIGGAGSALAINLQAAGGLTITTDALHITAGGITNAMLGNDSFTLTDDSNTPAVIALGTSFGLNGTDAIDVTLTGPQFAVSAKDATSTQKGVATFNSANFTVTSGDVTLNSSLADLTNVTADTATDGFIMVADGTNFTPRKIHHVEVSASSVSHTITHNIGQKFCNVTIVDSGNDEVIIPQSITFTDANVVTVALNSALAITVIVTGV